MALFTLGVFNSLGFLFGLGADPGQRFVIRGCDELSRYRLGQDVSPYVEGLLVH